MHIFWRKQLSSIRFFSLLHATTKHVIAAITVMFSLVKADLILGLSKFIKNGVIKRCPHPTK